MYELLPGAVSSDVTIPGPFTPEDLETSRRRRYRPRARRAMTRPRSHRPAIRRRRRLPPIRRTRSRPAATRYPVQRRRRARPAPVVRRIYSPTHPVFLPSAARTPLPAAILSRFSPDGTRLRRDHVRQIRQLALQVADSWRTNQPIRALRFVGHTDDRGSARRNRQLGQQRALAVKQRFIYELRQLRAGLVRQIDIVARSAGGTRPIACNRTIPGRLSNHRVHIYIRRRPD